MAKLDQRFQVTSLRHSILKVNQIICTLTLSYGVGQPNNVNGDQDFVRFRISKGGNDDIVAAQKMPGQVNMGVWPG